MRTINSKQLYLAAAIAGMCIAQPASATIILDAYEGGSSVKSNGTSYGDVIGSTSNFQINSMDVSMSGNILTVIIDTTFGGKGDNGLFSSYTNTAQSGLRGIGYGDLFLSSTWTPFGTSPYALDDNTNGTVWSHGFSLDDRWGVENVDHDGTLYKLNSGNNNADAYLSDDFLSSSDFSYRNGQEIAVDTDNGDVSAREDGTWSTTVNTVSFEIDLSGTSLANSNTIALHWGMSCGNDTIEGQFTKAPEPAILGLLGLGLLGMGLKNSSLGKRKKT